MSDVGRPIKTTVTTPSQTTAQISGEVKTEEDPATPFGRFEDFVKKIAAVPKEEDIF